MNNGVNKLLPFNEFESASRNVLAYLHKRLGFDLWMVTRVIDNDWIVLQTEENGYQVKEGNCYRWEDSYCSKMVENKGPRIAFSSMEVPIYAVAAINKQYDIKSYIGIPLYQADGELFGTLCSIDTQVKPRSIEKELPIIELLAKLLSTILNQELRVQNIERSLPFTFVGDFLDSFTSLPNRKAWDQIAEKEEVLAARFGNPISVIAIETGSNVSKQNSEELHKVSLMLKSILPSTSFVARLSDDVLGITLPNLTNAQALVVSNHVRKIISKDNNIIKIGMATRHSEKGMSDALFRAIQTME